LFAQSIAVAFTHYLEVKKASTLVSNVSPATGPVQKKKDVGRQITED